LLLPPAAGGYPWGATLDLAGDCQRRAAHLRKGPARLYPRVDVETPGTGGLWPAGQPEVFEHLPGDQGDFTELGPGDRGHRVQVDPQLVRMIEVAGPDRMRIEVDASEVDDPGELGRLADDDLLGGPARGKAEHHRLDPLRARAGRPLLEEGFTLGPVDEALERHRPPGHPAYGSLGHGQVVTEQIGLGVAGSREEDLVRITDGDLPSTDIDHLASFGHARTIRRIPPPPLSAVTMPGDGDSGRRSDRGAAASISRFSPARPGPEDARWPGRAIPGRCASRPRPGARRTRPLPANRGGRCLTCRCGPHRSLQPLELRAAVLVTGLWPVCRAAALAPGGRAGPLGGAHAPRARLVHRLPEAGRVRRPGRHRAGAIQRNRDRAQSRG